MKRRIAVALVASLGLGFGLPGCGESVDFPDTAPLTGKVTFDGKPLEGAELTFSPIVEGAQAGAKTYGARATSKADGTFSASTYFSASRDEEGAVPGKYKVGVHKYESGNAGPMSHQQALENAPGKGPEYVRGRAGQHGLTGKELVPEKYIDPAKSGIEVEVKPGSGGTVNVDIKTK